jgi:hypothetical protein
MRAGSGKRVGWVMQGIKGMKTIQYDAERWGEVLEAEGNHK